MFVGISPQTQSEEANILLLSLMTSYTRCCKVYFIRNKSEIFNKFKEFELLTTNECGLSIGTLQSDNGKEYFPKEFEPYTYCQEGYIINFQPHTPAQNGVAERINRTLMESAYAMMAQAELPEYPGKKQWLQLLT